MNIGKIGKQDIEINFWSIFNLYMGISLLSAVIFIGLYLVLIGVLLLL